MPQSWVDFAGVFIFSGVAGITAAFERTLDRVAEDQTRDLALRSSSSISLEPQPSLY
jgi:hypothetical protein